LLFEKQFVEEHVFGLGAMFEALPEQSVEVDVTSDG